MMNAETIGDRARQPAEKGFRIGRVIGVFRKPLKFFIGALLLLTPLTALIVLGWLQRLTERKSAKYLSRHYGVREQRQLRIHDTTSMSRHHWPGLFVHDGFRLTIDDQSLSSGRAEKRRMSFLSLWFGGLWDNLKAGVQSLIALAILTLPFGALWFLGWWSGWQNSFTKGYEQAFAGPTISLLGVILSLAALSYLPMALAHLSLERRIAAFFEFGKVIKLIHASAWRYISLSIAFVIASFPVFLATAAPVFIENIKPGFLDMPPQALDEFKDAYHFWMSVYILMALIILRSWTARIYAQSAVNAYSIDEAEWRDTRLIGFASEEGLNLGAPSPRSRPRSRPGKIRAIILTVLLPIIWFGLVAQTYVGQFMNYKWWNWLNHPLIQIPWFPPLGPWG